MKLIGLVRLGRDAEVRYTPDGTPVAEFSGAFDFGKKPTDGSQRPVQWVDFKLWGDRGDKLGPHLKKGQLLFVVAGDVHVEAYLKKSDQSAAARLVARVDDVQFAGPKPDGETAGDGQRTLPGQPGAAAAPPPASAPPRSTPPGSRSGPAAPAMRSAVPAETRQRAAAPFDDMDDDIPF